MRFMSEAVTYPRKALNLDRPSEDRQTSDIVASNEDQSQSLHIEALRLHWKRSYRPQLIIQQFPKSPSVVGDYQAHVDLYHHRDLITGSLQYPSKQKETPRV